MDHIPAPNYTLNDQLYESSDKTIKIFKVKFIQANLNLVKKKVFDSIHSN